MVLVKQPNNGQAEVCSSGSGLTVAGLFAGIGGLELGLGRAGHKSELFCEIDECAQAVLADQFQDTPLVGDIRGLEELPNVDLVAAGFPCQDLSQAGRGAGIGGRQSGQVEEVFRLIAQSSQPPEWILFENVPFMLHLDRGAAMRYLTKRLEDLGYSWAYRTVDAQAFGLPQRRRRVLVLASRTEDPREVLLSEDIGTPDLQFPPEVSCGFYWTEGNRGLGWATDAIPPLKGSSGLGIPSSPAIWSVTRREIVTPHICDAERLQGFPPGWTATASTVGHASKQVRWRLVGNAVSVPVAEWLGRRLNQPMRYDQSADSLIVKGGSWPTAGWSLKGNTYSSNASAWPVCSPRHHLAEFLNHPTQLLSERATSGFLKRLRASRLRVPERFVCDLEHHVHCLRSANGKSV